MPTADAAAAATSAARAGVRSTVTRERRRSRPASGAIVSGRRPTYVYGSVFEIDRVRAVGDDVAARADVDRERGSRRAVVVAQPRRRRPRPRTRDARSAASATGARSTRWMTAASKPTPRWNRKWRAGAACVADAEADPPRATAPRATSTQLRGGVDRVVGDAERAREHVRRAAGQRRERGVGAGEPAAGLVERAVAGEHRDDVDAVARPRRARARSA